MSRTLRAANRSASATATNVIFLHLIIHPYYNSTMIGDGKAQMGHAQLNDLLCRLINDCVGHEEYEYRLPQPSMMDIV